MSQTSAAPGDLTARPIRAACVLEQSLGHVTHAQNLRTAATDQQAVQPTWLPIPFEVNGAERYVPLMNHNWSVRASWRARRAVAGGLRGDRLAQRYDALLFHTQVTSLFSVDLMRQVPTVISLDATPINYDTVGAAYGHQPAGDGFVDRQAYRLNHAAFHAAHTLVAWSEWARQSLVDDYGVPAESIRVLAPGAARAYFDIGQRRAERSANADANGDGQRPVRILFVGGDFNRKGGPLLLDAFTRGTLAERCELHLVTAADVAPAPNVHVHHGLKPNSPELLQQFEQADVFVLPTYGECLAVVLMEATAAGLPVITTDVAALREAVRPGSSGFLLPPGDGTKLYQALEQLVADPVRRRAMGRAGYALAREKFDAQRNNLAMFQTLAEAASQRQPGTVHPTMRRAV